MTERDFFANRFSEDEFRALLGDTPPREVFASRSPSMKKLGLEPDKLSDDDLVRLMLQEPRLLRRPLLIVDGRVVVGVTAKTVRERLQL